jgi:trimeric autotransporter adhesin
VQLKPNELRTYNSKFPNIHDPWAPRIDLSLFKSFPVRERVRIEFRAESFNSFNTPIYGPPDTSITSPTFGVVTKSQINYSRNMQFALRVLF